MSSGSVIGANEYDDKMPSIPRSTEMFLAMAGLNFPLLPVGELLPRMLPKRHPIESKSWNKSIE